MQAGNGLAPELRRETRGSLDLTAESAAGVRVRSRGPFVIGALSFPTKAAAIEACRADIDARPHNAEFESSLISTLIAEHHYYCSRAQLIPSLFRKSGGRNYAFSGRFPEPVGWHLVSWRKCFNPPTFESEVAGFFRREFAKLLDVMQAEFRPPCSACGSERNVHMHHERPTFKEMMHSVLPFFSREERANWLGYDWSRDEAFSVPLSHDVHQEYLRLQAGASLVPLCAKCHAAEHRSMRDE